MSLLPSCPSCGQSVLDDDATECPFCGASMKGGKSAAPKPAAGAAKPAAPAKKAAAKKADADDDNPFGTTGPMSSRKAIQLLAKPGKGKLHRIVCPMCESPGFWSKDAVGQEVKCANPECLMPVFTAPHPDGEAPAASTKPAAGVAKTTEPADMTPKKPKSMLIPVIVGVAVLGGGILVWFQMASKEAARLQAELNRPSTPKAVSPVGPDGSPIENPMVDPMPETTDPMRDPMTAVKSVVPSNDEQRAEGLKRIVEFAADPENKDRKGEARRLAAETMAHLADMSKVDEQLKQFDIVDTNQAKYYHLSPLTIAIWGRIAANDMTQAKAIFERALERLPSLPERGGFPLELAIEMASLQLMFDQQDAAIATISATKNERELEAQLEAQFRAERTGRFNLDEAITARSVSALSRGWSLVAFNLTMRGQAAKAIAWAKAAPQSVQVADSLAAVAEGLLATSGNLNSVALEIDKLSPGAQARAWSRLAIAQHMAGQADAKTTLKKATDQSDKLAAGSAPKVPNIEGVFQLKIEDMSARLDDAMSVAEVAHAQLVLGDAAASWTTLLKATNLARTTAPLAADIEKLINTTKDESTVKSTLVAALKLKGDGEINAAITKFRSNSRGLVEASSRRTQLIVTLLELGIEWGLAEEVWTEIKTRATTTDRTEVELWFDTKFPSACLESFRAAGKADKVSDVEQTVGAEKLNANRSLRTFYRLEAQRLAAPATPQAGTQVATKLKEFSRASKESGDRVWSEQWLMRTASQYVAQGKTPAALALAVAIDDAFLRENVLETVAAQATRANDTEALRAFAYNRSIKPLDRVAILRGMLVQLPK